MCVGTEGAPSLFPIGSRSGGHEARKLMGYASSSRSSMSVGSPDRSSGIRAVLSRSLDLSESADEISEEVAPVVCRGSLSEAMSSSASGGDSAVVASSHRSVHREVTYEGGSTLADLLPVSSSMSLPALVKTPSLESVASAASSTSSSARSAAPVSPSRLIFSRYWETKKEQKIAFFRELPSLSPPVLEADKTAKSFSSLAEQLDKTNDASSPRPLLPVSPSSRRRRSIFGRDPSCGDLASSLTPKSSFDLMAQLSSRPPVRKAASTSALLSSRRSCLRTVQRYSPSGSPDGSELTMTVCTVRRSRSSSVSFSPEVDVFEFQKPKEQHAQDGWSNLFH